MDNNPFNRPRLKIQRANRHILDFVTADDAHFKAHFQTEMAMKFDPQTGDLTTPPITFPEPSSDMLLMAGDAIYNLRCALDQAMSRAAVAAGNSPKTTYFPHGVDLEGFRASVAHHCKKVPAVVIDAVAALEPYKGGKGYLFRALHDLNVIDKHTDLLTTGYTAKMRVEFRKGPYPAGQHGEDIRDGPQAIEDDQHTHLELGVAVTFAGVETIQGQPAGTLLRQLCDLVWQTIEIIERATLEHLAAAKTLDG